MLFKIPLCPWRPIDMRPLWGRFFNILTPGGQDIEKKIGGYLFRQPPIL